MRAFALLGLSLIILFPALYGGFIWDDIYVIAQNQLLRDSHGLWKIWFSHESIDYWPLSNSLFLLEWRLFGENTLGYHLISALIHAGNAILLMCLLRRFSLRSAFVCAALFCVHPVNVEAAAWIVQQKTLLCYFLALLSLLFFTSGGKDFLGWVCLLLSLLAKAASVPWPIVLLGFIYFKKGSVGRRDWIRLAPFFALSLVCVILNIYWYSASTEIVRDDGWLSQLLIASRSVWFYLGKVIWPFQLNFVYPRVFLPLDSFYSYLPLGLLLGVLAALGISRKPLFRPLCIGFLYFLVMLIPVLGFYPVYFMRFSFVADHWQYLSIAGLLAAGCETFAEIRWRRIIAALVVVSLALLSFSRSRVFASDEDLWRDTLARNPQAWLAHNEWGVILRRRGEISEATAHFRQSLEIQENSQAHNGLGVIYENEGKTALAIHEYREALRLKPNAIETRGNLGFILAKSGHDLEAESELRMAFSARPDGLNSYRLGYALEHQGRNEEAIGLYSRAMNLEPEQKFYHNEWQRLTDSVNGKR